MDGHIDGKVGFFFYISWFKNDENSFEDKISINLAYRK